MWNRLCRPYDNYFLRMIINCIDNRSQLPHIYTRTQGRFENHVCLRLQFDERKTSPRAR